MTPPGKTGPAFVIRLVEAEKMTPPNQTLHLTGAATLVLRGTAHLQAAPATELRC
jgi:hypothetical protein